jgi:hypothetical protein
LEGKLQRDFRIRRNQQVKVVGHENELVKQKLAFAAIVKQHLKEQLRHWL